MIGKETGMVTPLDLIKKIMVPIPGNRKNIRNIAFVLIFQSSITSNDKCLNIYRRDVREIEQLLQHFSNLNVPIELSE